MFYNKYILGEKEESLSVRASVGTDTHMIFDMFWQRINPEYLFDELKIDFLTPIDDNPVTLYFYGLCMTLTPAYDRDVQVLQRIFWKFALLHASRFLYLYNLFNGNKFKVWRYFKPKLIEEFILNEEYEIFGTIDSAFFDVDEKENQVFYLADYKTGNIPATVLKSKANVFDERSVKLPPKLMFEVHFYALLYLLKKGWNFYDEAVKRFIMYDEYKEGNEWKQFGLAKTREEQLKLNKVKSKYLTKLQPRFRKFDKITQKWTEFDYGDMQLGIIFLTGDPDVDDPVVVKKPFNYRSLRAALLKINTMRQMWFYRNYDDYYLVKEMKTLPEWNEYRCGICSRKEKCLKELEDNFKKGKI